MSSSNETYCNKRTTKWFTSRAPALASFIACISRDHITTGSRRLLSVSTLDFLSSFSLTNLSQDTYGPRSLERTVLFTSSNSFSSTILVISSNHQMFGEATPLEFIQRGIVNSYVSFSRNTHSCLRYESNNAFKTIVIENQQ